MKRSLILVLVTVIVALSGSEAVSGPSIGTVNRTAKKALSRANAALSKANAGPYVIETSQRNVPASPFDFARFDVRCPGGYVAVGIGVGNGALEPVFFASYGGGALASMFNPSDRTVYTGDLYVECVKASGYAASAGARPTKPQVERSLAAAEAARR